MKVLLVVLIFFSINSVFALEIDEKLTLRFLKVSNSKKTVLINRGAEDGLIVGDHAKFFITSGVIARGVVEKASPSRSIWSLYRVVDPDEITDGKVLNLKIASPVKITDDPSKSMKEEPISAGSDKMEMNDGPLDTGNSELSKEAEQKELEGMGMEEKTLPLKKESPPKANKNKESKEVGIIEETPIYNETGLSKNWELWGTLYVNALTGTGTSSNIATAGSTSASASSLDIQAGLEHYFFSSDNFLKNMSVTVFLHKRLVDTGQDIKMAFDWLEFGGGINYHFLNAPALTQRFIGFVNLSFGLGNVSETDGAVTNGILSEASPIKGTTTFISGGLGTKYILPNGFGLRALFDYYRSSESYNFPNSLTVNRTLGGPRIQVGASYRF